MSPALVNCHVRAPPHARSSGAGGRGAAEIGQFMQRDSVRTSVLFDVRPFRSGGRHRHDGAPMTADAAIPSPALATTRVSGRAAWTGRAHLVLMEVGSIDDRDGPAAAVSSPRGCSR